MYLEGKNAAEIAAHLGIKRREVNVALDNFRGLLKRSSETALDVRDRLLEIILESDESFRMVIRSAWETVEQADQSGGLTAKVSALKLVESSTKARSELLLKSGVSQDDEIIDQMNEQQRKHDVLISLLKEIKATHPEVAELISRKLSQVQDEVEVISVESD